MDILFLALATGGLAVALVVLLRATSLSRAFLIGFVFLAFGIVSALVCARAAPELGRFAAWGLFVHAPILLAAAAFRLRSPAAALVTAGLIIVGADGFLVEPQWLEVSRVRIASDEVHRPVRIALVADVQTDRVGAHERRAFRRLRMERPDLVLFAGDYVQGHPYKTVLDDLNRALRKEGVHAPRGMFAVEGDHDRPDWPRAFDGLPVIRLDSTSAVLDDVVVTGLRLRDSNDPRLVVGERKGFHIVLGHRPDFALSPDVRADLLVAGHTHGGQVRLPFVGPLITLSKVPRAWAAGTTALSAGRTLVVSRGIGMTRDHAPRVRFLCRPEIVIIDVVPKPGVVVLPQRRSSRDGNLGPQLLRGRDGHRSRLRAVRTEPALS
jgi:predicted MPP superfamily phosphohydrolase